MNGCSHECCWYPDSKIEVNTRPHLLTSYWPPEHNSPEQPHAADRIGLYYARCQSSFRPKFVCAKPSCRRSIKPSYDPDRNEYRIDAFQNWTVRPLPSHNLELAAAFRASKRMARRGRTPERRAFQEIVDRYFLDRSSVSAQELATLKAGSPEFWWTELIRNGQPDAQIPASHNIRCPSCGDHAVRVGSTFEVPSQKDEKSWLKIERMIQSGDDMVAKFSCCATVDAHKEMVEEALRLRAREKGAEAWSEEKQRRIAALGLLGEKPS
ncbi:hypothetical protein FRC08_008961 [Ceratobasidium sp. 394]|nr:hypothetical protein FRC08_008961 [Ceratobasidium sp. 394]